MRTFCIVINYIADGLCMSDPVGHAESVMVKYQENGNIAGDTKNLKNQETGIDTPLHI
jgi:hypothetical protein